MSESAHVRYRSRLLAVQDDQPFVELAVRMDDSRTLPGDWIRTYARFQPCEEPFALVVLGTREGSTAFRFELFERRPEDLPHACVCEASAIGWIRAAHFTADPRLSTLPAFAACAGEVTLVRYRPGRRCTFSASRGEQQLFAKVYADDRGKRIGEVGRQLQDAADRGELGCHVAHANRWDAMLRTLWQQRVPGTPLASVLNVENAAEFACRVGQAVAALSRTPLTPEQTFDLNAQQQRTLGYIERLQHTVSDAAALARELLADVESHLRPVPHPLVPIHGAPHPKQWLVTDRGELGLVDFDRFSRGDAELDLATFISGLEYESDAVDIAEAASECVRGFASLAGRVDQHKLAAYRVHRRIAKAYRAAHGLHPSADDKARRVLETSRHLVRASA